LGHFKPDQTNHSDSKLDRVTLGRPSSLFQTTTTPLASTISPCARASSIRLVVATMACTSRAATIPCATKP
jgi:hypothetical protein